jgi:hypothetical protein
MPDKAGDRLVGGQEVRHLPLEDRPGRFVLEQDVVRAVQRDQPRSGDRGGQQPTLLERAHLVATGVQHERGHRESGQQLGDVRVHALVQRVGGDRRRDRHPLQVVHPAHLFLGRAGDHQRGEHPPEQGVLPTPADPHDLLEGGAQLDLVGRRVAQRSGEAAVEHQLADPLRIADRVCDRHRAALGHPHQREPVEPGGVDDRLQIADPRLQTEVGDLPVRQPVPALVVAHHRRDRSHRRQEVPPYRALPVILEMAEPARRYDQRRAGGHAVPRVRDPHAIRRPAEPDFLRDDVGARGARHVGIVTCPAAVRRSILAAEKMFRFSLPKAGVLFAVAVQRAGISP